MMSSRSSRKMHMQNFELLMKQKMFANVLRKQQFDENDKL